MNDYADFNSRTLWRRALLTLLFLMLLAGCKAPSNEEAPGEAKPKETKPAEPSDLAPSPEPPPVKSSLELTEEGALSQQQIDRTFTLSLSGQPRELDPSRVTDSRSAFLALNAFEGLMAFDAGTGPVVQGLAQSYALSEGGTRYTFKLREGLQWSNGDPLLAQDFVFAWRRVLDPKNPSPYAWILTDSARIKGALAYMEGRAESKELGLSAPNDHTLIVDLEEPAPHFIELTALPTFAPLNESSISEHAESWTSPTHFVCSGPFELAARPDDHTLIYHKNPHYWNAEEVWLERFVVKLIPSDRARREAFERGELNWTGPEHLALEEDTRARLADTVRIDPFLAVEYLVFNTRRAPLSRAEVRQAIASALDKAEIVDHALAGIGRTADGLVPPLPGFRSQVEASPRDVERAKTLLAKGGFASGEVFPPLIYKYPQENETAARVALLLQSQLKDELGVELELRPRPHRALLDELASGDFQVARAGWIADFVDPAAFLEQWRSTSAQNHAGWSSEQYDDLLDRAAKHTERAQRLWLLEQAELILAHELPIIPLYHVEQVHLLDPRFSGIEPHVLSIHPLSFIEQIQAPQRPSDTIDAQEQP